jgi:hypothetical protein
VTGVVSTNTQISTSALATGSGGVAGTGNTSRIQIENKSKNRFWQSLEKNLKDLLHETDKVFPEGSTETVTEQARRRAPPAPARRRRPTPRPGSARRCRRWPAARIRPFCRTPAPPSSSA